MAKIETFIKRGESLQPLAAQLFDLLEKEGQLHVVADSKKSYSNKQRGSLHLWCEFCARHLNDLGIEHTVHNEITGQTYSMPWSKILFKEAVYSHVMKALTGKESTEEQDSIDPSKVAEIIHRRYAENGVTLPDWPSRESLMFNQVY